ncbi:hypothetical protein [Nonomuraea sp. NPDC005692]|uniref:hypothetical protein n=1 Tax=Nonomuraea sp. NPDC005692 TaxID=3157168 RepID=UPI00340C5369
MGVAVTGMWSFTLLNRTPDWNPWLRWVIVAATVLAVLAMVAARLPWAPGHGVVVASVTFTLVAALAGPGAYAAVTAFGGGNTSGNALAGPYAAQAQNGQVPNGQAGNGPAPPQVRGGMLVVGGPAGELSDDMVGYLLKNRGGARWLVAVVSAQQASSIILSTGEPVMAMGGFTGQDPAMTVARLQEYVRKGELRHIVINGSGRSGPMSGDPAIASWVRKNGTRVPTSAYGGTSDEGGGELYRLG